MSAPIYRVSGLVEASDGSSYEPTYWGSLATALFVFDLVIEGGRRDGAGYEVTLDTGPGSVPVRKVSRPVPAELVEVAS